MESLSLLFPKVCDTNRLPNVVFHAMTFLDTDGLCLPLHEVYK